MCPLGEQLCASDPAPSSFVYLCGHSGMPVHPSHAPPAQPYAPIVVSRAGICNVQEPRTFGCPDMQTAMPQPTPQTQAVTRYKRAEPSRTLRACAQPSLPIYPPLPLDPPTDELTVVTTVDAKEELQSHASDLAIPDLCKGRRDETRRSGEQAANGFVSLGPQLDSSTGDSPATATTTARDEIQRHATNLAKEADLLKDRQDYQMSGELATDPLMISGLNELACLDHPDLSSILPEDTYAKPKAALAALPGIQVEEKPVLAKAALEAVGILLVEATSAQILALPHDIHLEHATPRAFLVLSQPGFGIKHITATVPHIYHPEWNETVPRL